MVALRDSASEVMSPLVGYLVGGDYMSRSIWQDEAVGRLSTLRQP